MNGILKKIDNEWQVQWSDLHSFGFGWHWMFTPLHPDETVDEKELKDGDKVEIEFIMDNENFNPFKYVKILNKK